VPAERLPVADADALADRARTRAAFAKEAKEAAKAAGKTADAVRADVDAEEANLDPDEQAEIERLETQGSDQGEEVLGSDDESDSDVMVLDAVEVLEGAQALVDAYE
jgi:hypothetical protein